MKKVTTISLFFIFLSGWAFAHPVIKVHKPHYKHGEYYVIEYSPYYYVYYDYGYYYHSHKHHYKKYKHKHHYKKKYKKHKKKKYYHHY